MKITRQGPRGFICKNHILYIFFDHELRREVLKVTMLFLGIQTIYFLGREAAKKGVLGVARGQASNAIWAFLLKKVAR